jgi:hypothetical protein
MIKMVVSGIFAKCRRALSWGRMSFFDSFPGHVFWIPKHNCHDLASWRLRLELFWRWRSLVSSIRARSLWLWSGVVHPRPRDVFSFSSNKCRCSACRTHRAQTFLKK